VYGPRQLRDTRARRPARPHRLVVRTLAFQANNTGSIPVGDATNMLDLQGF
jgi:hypothetical protein